MNEQELIAAVKAAKTKDELEALVKAELGIDLDKRRGLENLRADILAGLGAMQQEQQVGVSQAEQPQLPGESEHGKEVQEGRDVLAVIEDSTQLPAEPLADGGLESVAESELQLPELEDEDEPEKPAPRNRMLRNRENGREFVWTPELAKLNHMEEV